MQGSCDLQNYELDSLKFISVSSSKLTLKLPFQRIRNKSSLYLHACLTKSGYPPGPPKGDSWSELYTYCRTKRLNFYEEANGANFSASHSYWRPNWRMNLVGEVSIGFAVKEDGRTDGRINCEPVLGKYYPILYLNDNL